MKRLRDDVDSKDPIVANTAQIVASLAPLPESEVRRARVLRAIHKQQSARRSRLSRPLLAALIVLGSAATAGAALGVSSWIEGSFSVPGDSGMDLGQGLDATQGTAATQKLNVASDRKAANTSAQEKEVASQPEAVATSKTPEVEFAQAVNSEKDSVSRISGSSQAAVLPKAKASLKKPSAVSEAVLVQQAVEALRQSNDPEQAAALLKEYQQKSPSGVLAEEALALSIEVALAQGSARAQAQAAQYLKIYPRGRFRALAERALK